MHAGLGETKIILEWSKMRVKKKSFHDGSLAVTLGFFLAIWSHFGGGNGKGGTGPGEKGVGVCTRLRRINRL